MTKTNQYMMRILPLIAAAALMADDKINLQVRSGVVKFEANTTFSAINVHGQSSSITAEATIQKSAGNLEIESLHAVLDPKSLSTGMSMRDEHMRKRIFTNAKEELPAIEFTVSKSSCPEPKPGQDAVCQMAGNLSMRGVAKPFAMSLKIRNDGKAYKVSGDGVVKLSAFGIEPPCQLKVCVADDVKLRLEMQAKEQVGVLSGGLR